MKFTREIQFIKCGKIYRHTDRLSAWNEHLFIHIIIFHRNIDIEIIVPLDYITVKFTVFSAGHIYAERFFRKHCSGSELRHKILFGIRVVQFIVIIGIFCHCIKIFRELPFQRACAVAEPQYLAAACIAGVQFSPMVYGIYVILFGIFIPNPCIYYDLLSVGYIGYTYTVG